MRWLGSLVESCREETWVAAQAVYETIGDVERADALRTRRRRPFSLVRDDADLEALAASDPADRVGEGAVVSDLLDRLDADRREAFVLTQLLGLSYAEAAEVAGCPVGTIRSRVARARGDLIDALTDDTRPEEATGR